MPLELALTSRRENPILAPFLDQLRGLAGYGAAALCWAEADYFTFITYRGPVPQTHALSLSIPRQGWETWVKAIETGRPAINEEGDDTTVQDTNFVRTLEKFVGQLQAPPARSLLAVPLQGETGTAYLLALWHDEPHFYTPELGDQVLRFALENLGIIENSARYAELAQRAVEAEILLSVQRAITRRLDLREALRLIVEEARNLTFARSACILALEESKLRLAAHSGEQSTYPSSCDGWTVDAATIDDLDGAVSRRRGDVAAWLGAPAAAWLGQRDFVAAPLRYSARVTGLLVVVDKRLGVYDSRDERRLAMLASVAGVCVENARLYQQARQVAALEERDRLSRELHDNLSQVLGSVNWRAATLDRLLSLGEIDHARANLLELKQLAKQGYADVRDTIFALRSTASVGSELLPALEQYLAECRTYHGLNAELSVETESFARLPAGVQLQIIRVAHEALINVQRHAGASRLQVRLREGGDGLRLEIEDNGRGFDWPSVGGQYRQHFGLLIMRERAAGVGGELEIDSRPGEGTRVVLRLPLDAREIP